MSVLKSANDGVTILVDDIDFTPTSPTVAFIWSEIDKSITLKSGKPNASAVFTDGAFVLVDSKIAGEKLNVKFENIIFDGNILADSLTADNCLFR